MSEGPEDSRGFNFRPKIPTELVPGSVWRHANGELYFVDSIRNLYSEDQDEYPTTVSYIRMADGTEWCKPVQGFLNKRVYVKQNGSLWAKELAPYTRWRNRRNGNIAHVMGVYQVYSKAEGDRVSSVSYVFYLPEGELQRTSPKMQTPGRFMDLFEKLPPAPRVRAPQS